MFPDVSLTNGRRGAKGGRSAGKATDPDEGLGGTTTLTCAIGAPRADVAGGVAKARSSAIPIRNFC